MITKCDDCGKDIQVNPTNWQLDNKRRCIKCQNKRKMWIYRRDCEKQKRKEGLIVSNETILTCINCGSIGCKI